MKNPAGVIIFSSEYSVNDTINRLEGFLREHGVTIYARIDQQAELQKAGLAIPPLQFLLFGNPKGGGPIMSQAPVAALDLPLKLVAWEDEAHKVWLAYNDGAYLQARYGLPAALAAPLDLAPVVAKAMKP